MVVRVSGRNVRRSENQWRRVISRYRESGLSVAAFCRTEAVSEANFYRWRTRIERDSGGDTKVAAAPEFVDLGTVHVADDSGTRLALKIEIARFFTLNLVRG